MDAKTNFLEDRVLDRVLKNNADFSYTFPATVYAGLFTADPTETGSLTNEVSGVSYARQAITWGTIAAGTVANSVAVTFPVAGGSWGTITYVGILDVVTLATGNMLYYGVLGTPKTVGLGDQVSFAIGALTIAET
jgi:hypothetical protein